MQKVKLSSLSIIFILLVFIWNSFNESRWVKAGVMTWDVACYYGYLTKAFNHKSDSLSEEEKKFPSLYPGNKYVTTTEGVKVLKTSMGMSVMYLPFYWTGYALHLFNTGCIGNGLEIEYRMMMHFCGIFYLILSLLLLQYFLRKHFTETVCSVTLLVISFGTNLFYYAAYEGCMPHIADLFLFLLFIYGTEKWHSNSSVKNTVLMGLLAGLIVLVRPINLLVGIFFLLYGVVSFTSLLTHLKYLASKWYLLLLMSLCADIVWIPQIIYWYTLTGHYFFFSYVGERFFFDHPMIYQGMIGGRKGWLLYTPLGWFMLVGFFFMYKRVKNLFFSSVVFYLLFVYVIFSWWCWWYGGGFSCRAMIDAYGILSFPLASLLSVVYTESKKVVRIFVSLILLLLVALNLFQTWQYKRCIIHYDSMNYKAYANTFLKVNYQPDSIFTSPPIEAALKGEYTE